MPHSHQLQMQTALEKPLIYFCWGHSIALHMQSGCYNLDVQSAQCRVLATFCKEKEAGQFFKKTNK